MTEIRQQSRRRAVDQHLYCSQVASSDDRHWQPGRAALAPQYDSVDLDSERSAEDDLAFIKDPTMLGLTFICCGLRELHP